MKNLFIFFTFILVFTHQCLAQTTPNKIHGTLTNEAGEIIPFANVYIEGTTIGTTTNIEGKFSLQLSTYNPNYQIVFQYIGYTKTKFPIEKWEAEKNPTIILKKEKFELNTFTVTASGKDPAYAIIKKAQKARKKYLKQIQEYSGKVYMKGRAYLYEIPKIPLLISVEESELDSIEYGLIGITESVANFHVQPPNNYKEEMLASQNSLPGNFYSWNRANQVMYNFYENNIPVEGLSDRDFISPIASTAMATYDYKLEGTFKENGFTVNKILVTPKRKTDLAFHGHIYITENLWNIYAVNLSIQKPTPLKLSDTVTFIQNYAPIKEDIWLPRSLEMRVSFNVIGIKGAFHAIGMFSEYNLNPNFKKDFFSNEVFSVADTAKTKDSTFWAQSRQVVLSTDEKTKYHESDSIEKRLNSPEHLDSLDKRNNKINLQKILLTGYTHRNRAKKHSWSIDPMLTIVQFNTVEGLVLHPKIRFNNNNEESKYRGKYTFGYRYGHLSQYVAPQFTFSKYINRKKLSGLSFDIGQDMKQINNHNPISNDYNTFYTLQYELNHAKYYRSKYVKLRFQQELVNGLLASAEIGYEQRFSQNNRSDYKWKNIKHRKFTPNVTFVNNNKLIFNVATRITFKQKYESYPERKVILGSSWPKLYLMSNNAFATSKSDASYHQIKLAVNDNISLGGIGRFHYTVQTGKFLKQQNTTLADYEHFNGNEVAISPFLSSTPYLVGSELEKNLTFHTLPYYTFSTNNAFIEAHAEHHFNGFIINKIPLLRKSKFETLAGVNALYTDAQKEFTELYVGIENILSILRIDAAASYTKGGKIEPALRFSVKANF